MAEGYQDVLGAWDQAPEDDIHPLWTIDRDAYWQSGWDQAAEAAAYAKKGDLVIDFGCGNGRLTAPLAKLGLKVIAADASQRMLDLTAATLKEAGARAEQIRTDGSDLAKRLGKRRAAVIVARAVMIHHAPEDVERLLKQLAAALKRGGVIVTDLPLADQAHARAHWRDVTRWTRADRAAMLARVGLTEVEGDDVVVLRRT